MRTIRFIPALVLLALTACDSENPTEPTVDVDAALTQMATGGISSYTTAAAAASVGGVTVPMPASSSASCPYDSGTKFFVCAPVTANGMTFNRRFQLLDASGNALSTANPLVIASIRSVVDLEGTISQPAPNQGTVQLDRHEDATLSGIQSTSRVLNGTAEQQMTLTTSGFSLSANETSVTSNLQLPSSPEQKYPLGGTITANGSMTLGGVAAGTQQYQREISFDGTSVMTVKMSVTGSATTTCKVNLASPGTAPTCT